MQLTVRASSRLQTALATVRVFITRDVDERPFFISQPYRRTIPYNQIANETILTVSARDNDLVVSF